MVKFSNDVDILKYEPKLFGEWHLPWQVLTAGSGGTLSGTTFTASGADFINSSIEAGQVIYLESETGPIDGAYEIVSVNSATELTVSVIRTDPNDEPIAPPAATNVSYRISTFGPQASEIGIRLTEYFDIRPGNSASNIDVEHILDADVLKAASIFAVISSVYTMLANSAEDENLWKKSLHYQKLFEKARERCRLSIDIDGDETADITKSGASRKLTRD